MHNIADYIEWDEPDLIGNGELPVLVWSKAKGYYFTQYGFVFGIENKIIARKL